MRETHCLDVAVASAYRWPNGTALPMYKPSGGYYQRVTLDDSYMAYMSAGGVIEYQMCKAAYRTALASPRGTSGSGSFISAAARSSSLSSVSVPYASPIRNLSPRVLQNPLDLKGPPQSATERDVRKRIALSK